jgi:hypothetical protein
MEVWKPVKDYENYYEVSNLGRVKGLEREILKGGKNKFIKIELILKPSVTSKYLAVSLLKNKIKKTKRIHQLVAESFLNHNCNKHYLIVDHINENKLDNKLNNLQIITTKQNLKKSITFKKTKNE